MVTKQQFDLIQKYMQLARERRSFYDVERESEKRKSVLNSELEKLSKQLKEEFEPTTLMEHEGVFYLVSDGYVSILPCQKLEQLSIVKNY